MLTHHITLYTCGKCDDCQGTEKKLNKLHLPYRTVDINDPDKMLEMRRLTHSSTHPGVIITHGQAQHMFNGYRPELLERIADGTFFN